MGKTFLLRGQVSDIGISSLLELGCFLRNKGHLNQVDSQLFRWSHDSTHYKR